MGKNALNGIEQVLCPRMSSTASGTAQVRLYLFQVFISVLDMGAAEWGIAGLTNLKNRSTARAERLRRLNYMHVCANADIINSFNMRCVSHCFTPLSLKHSTKEKTAQ